MLLVILLIIITACYLGLIVGFLYGWKKLPDFSIHNKLPQTGFSLIIPYRDEAKNLPSLFKSLAGLNYPRDKFEIILVNDGSRDTSKKLCEEFQRSFTEMKIVLLDSEGNSLSPKKAAIHTAIKSSVFDYIITTDADCIVPVKWLIAMDQEIVEENSKLIAGPVAFVQLTGNRKAAFQIFEEMDFLSLQSTTIGSFGIEKPFMCNAANLCYEKKTFLELFGFSGHDKIASGDDVFLLQEMSRRGIKLSFIKSNETIVFTKFQKSIGDLINQRIRWASKASAYNSSIGKFTGLIVFLINLFLLIYASLAFLQIVPYQIIMLVFLLKFNADFLLIYKAAKFFNRESLMRSYFWCSLLYPFFSVYVAVLSFVRTYEWKGRRFRK